MNKNQKSESHQHINKVNKKINKEDIDIQDESLVIDNKEERPGIGIEIFVIGGGK